MSKFEKSLKTVVEALKSNKNFKFDSSAPFDIKSGKKVLVYGSYGYTGELITRLIKEHNLQNLFILGGRNQKKLNKQFEEMGFKDKDQMEIFSVSTSKINDNKQIKELDSVLKGNNVGVLLNCAGPFSQTAYPLIEACVRNGVNYLDITGEYKIFEHVHQNRVLNEKANQKNIVILPGVGYDVVPSDCLAKATTDAFHKKFPDEEPNDLKLAMTFGSGGSDAMSHGTKKTMVKEMMTEWGISTAARRDGKIARLPYGSGSKEFKFENDKTINCGVIPWGDISTAYFSTHVPNVTVYFAKMTTPRIVSLILNMWITQMLIGFLFHLPYAVQALMKMVEKFTSRGPTDDMRKKNKHLMRCEVSDKSGENKAVGFLHCCEGYTLTSQSALLSSLKVLMGDVKQHGSVTPSLAFGKDYVESFDDTEVKIE